MFDKNVPARVNWFIRNLPLRVYDYACYCAKRDAVLSTINGQILDIINLGFEVRQSRDREAQLQRVADLERAKYERRLREELGLRGFQIPDVSKNQGEAS
jgi:hypothetical protein